MNKPELLPLEYLKMVETEQEVICTYVEMGTVKQKKVKQKIISPEAAKFAVELSEKQARPTLQQSHDQLKEKHYTLWQDHQELQQSHDNMAKMLEKAISIYSADLYGNRTKEIAEIEAVLSKINTGR